jgi:FkbM family methyltransferase
MNRTIALNTPRSSDVSSSRPDSRRVNRLARIWHDFLVRLRFRFYLPAVNGARLEGVRLDLRGLSPMMKNIILTGRYEAQERRLCARSLRPGDVVLELGGAIGFVGLYCRKALGVKRVVSVEANPATLARLQDNYERNGLYPEVIHAAAGAVDGTLDLDVSGEFWENRISSGAAESGKRITVPALGLASILARLPEPPTALICDIEGAERFLDFSVLPRSVKTIIMELHPDFIGEAETRAILERLGKIGFDLILEDGGSVLMRRV